MNSYLKGNVLPVVIVISIIFSITILELIMLWSQDELQSLHNLRLRQARANIESAYTLWHTHPENTELTSNEGFLLYDSLPESRVFIHTEPWGLYEITRIQTADSLLSTCRLYGADPTSSLDATLFYADLNLPITLAGQTILQGSLYLPAKGLIYGHLNSAKYTGAQISGTRIHSSHKQLPQPNKAAIHRVDSLLSANKPIYNILPYSLFHSFLSATPASYQFDQTYAHKLSIEGRIILHANELHIDSTCRFIHPLIIARKIIIHSGTKITAQLLASDTVIVEPRVELCYPSGIYARQYVDIGAQVEVNGYVIIRDSINKRIRHANYRQAPTARVRGLLWIEGTAQIQGIISGQAYIKQAAYFSAQGYFRDMLYNVTTLENHTTAHPLWIASTPQRKEIICVN